MSKIDYQALRELAKQATQGEWVAFISSGTGTYAVHTPGDERCEDVIKWTGFDGQKNAENNAHYIAAFNPEVVQALLDERERNQQYIKRRDQENEEIALTVGRLRVELEGKDSKIANLTAERDALREGEMGDARYSNTRAAADIYFQLVEECEIPAGGSLVEYVDDMREKLESAEMRIAELELREVVLPQCYSMLHRVDFDKPYHTEMVYRQHQVLEALHNAGINVTEAGKGEAS
ncbi:ead/Ea22-like family protein [Escherichia coli]|uniref:ead/Ea22-like family protein n=1 Tax=Escherichia coli TaxID=562 RepID=UPI003FD0B2E0|nr:ead/Ea22-like family protein [Escherichia coli]EGH1334223.1 ead/Ea22-like family protein [Escherichia coli]EGJ5324091.1 ead/Ea22-like family protein [Escherichia coli]